MKKYLFSSPRVLLLGVLLSVIAAVPAYAVPHGIVNASECTEGSFSQPFQALKDRNWYTLAPGQSDSGFNGAGWELSGGAKIVTTTLPDGSTGTVLDLPSGARAVSPTSCITTDYPTARAYVRNVVGGEGVAFNVAYEGTKTWEQPKNTGQIHGPGKAEWGPSGNVNLQPEKAFAGWQPMRITLVGNGRTSDFQVYDLYLDPRLSH
jgi:hypothetical protein